MHPFSFLVARRAFLIFLSLVAFSACKPRLIPDSSVPDTRQNRAVMAFLDDYRKAMESKSVEAVMSLVAEDFYDRAAITAPPFAIDRTQLESKLQQTFDKVENFAVRFYVQHIEKRGNQLDVVYYFVQRALVKYPTNSDWITGNDVNRLVLRMKGSSTKDGFEIVSGL